jgi:hypothetical protein
MRLNIQEGQKGREWGKTGLTLLCFRQSKYQDKENPIKSASFTLHTSLTPTKVIKKIKEFLKNECQRT